MLKLEQLFVVTLRFLSDNWTSCFDYAAHSDKHLIKAHFIFILYNIRAPTIRCWCMLCCICLDNETKVFS